jgi:AcrR family transcriptional regulator
MARTKTSATTEERSGRRPSAPKRPSRYHHGALRQALLGAAELILRRDGINGLTLRAAAREAGVSHAAPKNHFDDVTGLLSELAAVGFQRFAARMREGVGGDDPPSRRMAAIGRGYVSFARAYPALFLLMFRSERLDMARPNLRTAIDAAARILSEAVGARRGEAVQTALTLPQAADIVASWSLVHGFAMLLLDGRLKPLLARLPQGADADALLTAVLATVRRADPDEAREPANTEKH